MPAMMAIVRRRWRGHRATLQPEWHILGPMPLNRAEAEALTCRLNGHEAVVQPIETPQTSGIMPGQLALFARKEAP